EPAHAIRHHCCRFQPRRWQCLQHIHVEQCRTIRIGVQYGPVHVENSLAFGQRQSGAALFLRRCRNAGQRHDDNNTQQLPGVLKYLFQECYLLASFVGWSQAGQSLAGSTSEVTILPMRTITSLNMPVKSANGMFSRVSDMVAAARYRVGMYRQMRDRTDIGHSTS